MENIIKQYYNLENIKNFRNCNGKIIFDSHNNSYILESIKDKKRVIYIYNKYNNNYLYDKIIKNIYNELYTTINGKDYVLIKIINKNISISDELINNKFYEKPNHLLDRSNWVYLWSKKLDYYEYQHKHIKDYSFINESFNYYLGMGETAIAYIEYNFKEKRLPVFISHNRINGYDFFNPLNIVVDYKARDICQYLKFLFLNKKYTDFDFNNFFNKLKLDISDCILLYGRLLFPCFYFDMYDEIINNNIDQKKILEIVSRANEYEQYINMLYNKINKIINIPEIEWLRKN